MHLWSRLTIVAAVLADTTHAALSRRSNVEALEAHSTIPIGPSSSSSGSRDPRSRAPRSSLGPTRQDAAARSSALLDELLRDAPPGPRVQVHIRQDPNWRFLHRLPGRNVLLQPERRYAVREGARVEPGGAHRRLAVRPARLVVGELQQQRLADGRHEVRTWAAYAISLRPLQQPWHRSTAFDIEPFRAPQSGATVPGEAAGAWTFLGLVKSSRRHTGMLLFNVGMYSCRGSSLGARGGRDVGADSV